MSARVQEFIRSYLGDLVLIEDDERGVQAVDLADLVERRQHLEDKLFRVDGLTRDESTELADLRRVTEREP